MNDTRMKNRTVNDMRLIQERIRDIVELIAKPKPDWEDVFDLAKKIARIAGDYEWELGRAMRGIR